MTASPNKPGSQKATNAFDRVGADIEPTSLTDALMVVAAGGHGLSKAQLEFNKKLKRVQKLRDSMTELSAVVGHERPLHAAEINPMRMERVSLGRTMCLTLHERLSRKGLTARTREDAETVLIALACDPAQSGDTEVQNILAIYAGDDPGDGDGLAQAGNHQGRQGRQDRDDSPDISARSRLREWITATTGISLTDLPPDASEAEIMQALQQRILAQRDAEALERQARKAKRQANRKPTAKQLEREAAEKALADLKAQESTDAEAAIRTVYRALASQLHPDRETDPHERERKSALMSEVNASYDKRDLLALLGLQLKINQTNPDKLQAFAAERLLALGSLLNEQYKTLTRDKNVLVAQIQDEFGLDWHTVIDARTLAPLLARERRQYAAANGMMNDVLGRMSDDKWFKAWVKREAEEVAQQSNPFGF